jgi:hypothetical protein
MHLADTDMALIEWLADTALDQDLRSFLLRFYGHGGELDAARRVQDAVALDCDHNCPECGACQSFCEASLLEQLYVIITLYECGLFDVATDNYETAKRKLHIQIDRPPEDYFVF